MEVMWSNSLAQAGPVAPEAFEHPQGWRQICDAFETVFMTWLLFITYPYHVFSLDLADATILIVNFSNIKIDTADTASRT